MKIKKLEKLKAYILEEPRRYLQSGWFYPQDSAAFQSQKPPCGTLGCLAGNACVMEGWTATADCPCRPIMPNWTLAAINDAQAATEGHMRLCEKWSKADVRTTR